ncbi:MAG: TrkA family potassium uptake protein [Firmicutes bacterium]|nr:TrkA family potassium uptake protein [Bacillota bacterium]
MARRQFAVIGLGRFGSSVASTLYQLGYDVLAVDADESKVQEMADRVTHAVQADATDDAALKALGIRNFDVVVLSIGEDVQASILATISLREAGVKYIVAKAINDRHGKVLAKIGADRVIYPERDMGVRLAHNLASGNVMDYIELAPGYSIAEVVAPPSFQGKTLAELDLHNRYNLIVMAIRHGQEIDVAPGAKDKVGAGDVLVAMGDVEGLARMEAELEE